MLSTLFKHTGLSALAAVAALALLGPAAPVQAQQGAVAGQVVDASNMQPIQGAQVTIQGTQLGALTDEDGRYRVTGVPAGQQAVRVRLLGYRTTTREVTVAAGETVTADFQLAVSAVELNQIVVTATGEQTLRQLGTSIGTVDASGQVARAKPTNITDLLAGTSTGVTVSRGSGSVGTADNIKIRGNTSIGLSQTPLIIVDGAYVSNSNATGPVVGGQDASRLNDINPDDIESIEIVKGPAATALYGTEAAAGVIRITTKQGSATGDTEYTFRGEIGTNLHDISEHPSSYVNAQGLFGETFDYSFLFGLPDGTIVLPMSDSLYQMNLVEESIFPGPGLRDIFRSPFRDGLIQTYGGNVRGGTEALTYYISGEFDKEEGNLPNNLSERFNARANMNLNPAEEVDISISTGFTSNELFLPDNDNNGAGFLGISRIGFPWQIPMTRDDPAGGPTDVETCPIAFEFQRPLADAFGGAVAGLLPLWTGAFCADNPFLSERTFDDVASLVNQEKIERFTGSAVGTYRPFDFLTNRVTVGYDEFSQDVPQLVPVDPNRPFGTFSEGFKTTFQQTSRSITLEGTSTLDLEVSEGLNSQFTAGAQWVKNLSEGTFATGEVLPAGCTTVSCAVTTTGGETFSSTIGAGLFFQEQLSWQNKLYLTGAIRFDDNSATGENLGIQTLPSVNASYLMSDEEWFPAFFEQFRIRGAWGEAGQQPGPFAAFRLLSPTRVTFFGGSNLAGITVTDPGNPDLAPEQSSEFEFGLDASVLDGRLSLEATYYDQTTENTVVFRNLKPSTGFPGQQPTNIGEISSKGVELSLDALAIDVENLSWNWRFQLSTNDGEVTRLENEILFGPEIYAPPQRHKEGFPFGSYFNESVGLEGGSIVVGDSARFDGHPTPEWNGSVSTNIQLFERVTLYGLLDFAGGHQNFNGTEAFLCDLLGGGPNGGVCGEIFFRNPDGTLTDEARIKSAATTAASEDPWIEDSDWAKIRTVSLQFRIPESLVGVFGASGANFTAVAENLGTFTGYTGMDPEVNFAGSAQQSQAEFLTVPVAPRFLGTFSVTF